MSEIHYKKMMAALQEIIPPLVKAWHVTLPSDLELMEAGFKYAQGIEITFNQTMPDYNGVVMDMQTSGSASVMLMFVVNDTDAGRIKATIRSILDTIECEDEGDGKTVVGQFVLDLSILDRFYMCDSNVSLGEDAAGDAMFEIDI